MQNVKLITSLLFVLIINDIQAQKWPVAGSKWYYDESQAFTSAKGYMLFSTENDTIIHQRKCSKILKSSFLICQGRGNYEYVYSKQDSVYFYDQDLDTFQLLYCFNAKEGESWEFYFKENLLNDTTKVKVVVDSISNIQINNRSFPVQHVTYTSFYSNFPYTHSSIIIYPFGDTHYLLNFFPQSSRVCDANWTTGLRCYRDDSIGLVHYNNDFACDYTTNINNENILDNSILFPNPASAYIHINCNPLLNKYKLFTSSGKLIKQGLMQDNKINIDELKSGFYSVEITSANYLNRIIKKFTIIK